MSASLLEEEWRGLAHFRTESRRRVFKKLPSDRTPSELYVLEEVFNDVNLISNLPFAKRIEICKLIKYMEVEEDHIVYSEGEKGDMFYVIFTGSVKVTATCGRKQKVLNSLFAGDSFGEDAFASEHNLRRETVTTLRRSELLTLSREDYESVLKTEVTEEVRAYAEVLMKVQVLKAIPTPSLFRLAGLLTPRTFLKNKVITFQGDEAREMFFIKSGECRVVMEVSVPATCATPALPRAASSLSQYRPTTHDHCKKEMKKTQKEWGHPHFFTRPQSRCRSVPPSDLGATTNNADISRPFSAPQPPPSKDQWPGFEVVDTGSAARLSPKRSGKSQITEVTAAARPPTVPKHGAESKLRRLSSFMKQEQQEKDNREREERIKEFAKAARKSRPFSQMSFRSYEKAKRQKGGLPPNKESMSYSLQSLMKEINQKFGDESIQDLDFSDQEALTWGMGTSDTGLQRGDIGDALNYQSRFEEWAKKVIARERKLLQDEIHSESALPSFRSVQQEPVSLQKIQLLDVGGLHAGEFFGELGLLTKTTRSATILTVTEVEVLVLNNSDFWRRLDKDVIKSLSSLNYKKAGFVHNQFNRTHRWESIKKRIMKEALMVKKTRFPNRFYHDMTDAARRKGPILV